MTTYEPLKAEEEILAFWRQHKIYEKAKEKGKGGKRYYFLDGPPYTSGKVHLGTAWNKSLKDLVLRYKRMRGLDVWDRAGYDMHGLPTEHATQRKLGLATKDDIERYGVANFITECKKLCIENMHVMNETFKRLGVWMDFENAYQSVADEFMEGEWWLVKRAHEQGRLYQGLKTMTWCPSCGSALAKHECEYQQVKEESIFVKFKVESEKDTYLLIWTTTPWTIPFNLAIMVNPELEYLKCKVYVKREDQAHIEHWIISKALAGAVIKGVTGHDFSVEEEFEGKVLEGMQYTHPFGKYLPYAEMRQEHPRTHTVVLSTEYVDTSAGTGLVHCAPGCGPEDYEIGVKNGLPPYNTLTEFGIFSDEMGLFAGKIAKKDDGFFITQLEQEGALLATNLVEHDYAHCWRCHNPVIFRATKQWFFKVEDIKERLIAQNDKIRWVPKAAYNAFDSWLKNLRDNSVTKQRYWGTALPVWQCASCGAYDVVASKKELEQHCGKEHMPKDLHKPWIDEVAWACSCGGTKKRIPDILDVWVDAGTVSWSCLDYPQKKKEFDELFPADFILEGKDQIRGWFNLLHVASNLAFNKPCFDACYMHGFIDDAQGRKMSKSLGNYILPEEVIGKYGADTFRYYAIGAAAPGLDMNYNFDDVELKHKNLFVFWNLHKFLLDLKKTNNLELHEPELLGLEERYLLSRLHHTIKKATERLEAYALNEVPGIVEECLMDLSRTYIQLVREKASVGSKEEKEAVLWTAFTAYHACMKLFSIVAPFFTEKVHQELKGPFGIPEESIHLTTWPEHDEMMLSLELEQDMAVAQDVMTATLAAREKAGLGVRWPLATITVEVGADDRDAVVRMEALFKSQLNVKEIRLSRVSTRCAFTPNYAALGKQFGQETHKVAEALKRHEQHVQEALERADETIEVGDFTVARAMLEVTRTPIAHEQIASFPRGIVSIVTQLTPELEAEGYMRELVRRIQQLRKEAGLSKNDRISLTIAGPKELLGRVATRDGYMQEKVGASKLLFAEHAPCLGTAKELKIKNAAFTISFSVES